MKKRCIVWGRCAVCAAALLFWEGCGSGDGNEPQERTVPVRTVVAEAGPRSVSDSYVGVVEEESASALSFQVAGHLERIAATEGERVAAGTVLAELGTENLRSTYEAAEASLRQAEDAMERLQMLYDKGSLPEIQYVEARTKLAQARSMEQVARKNLEDGRLVAPFAGVIGKRWVENGENVAPGQPVLTLLRVGTVKVKIPVPENEIAGMEKGGTAEISVPALGGRLFEGRLSEKSMAANSVSHTYDVRFVLPNGAGELMPGMVCRVRVSGRDEAPLVVLPNRAVQLSADNERFVWCVRDGKATAVPVETGPLTEDGVVIESGLSAGERVIVEGYHKVSEGMKVETL